MRVEIGNRSRLGGLGARSFALEMDFGLDPRKRKRHGERVAEARQRVDPWPAGIAQPEQLGHLVIRLAGGIIQRAPHE